MGPEVLDFGTFFSNYVRYYFTQYFILLMCIVPMFFILIRHPMIGKKKITQFHFVLVSLLIMSLLDSVDHCLADFGTKYMWDTNIRKIVCIICYMIKPIVSMFVAYSVVPEKTKIRHFLWIPLAINILVYSFNFFPQTSFFTITEANDWMEIGPIPYLVYFGFVAAGIYILLLIGFSIYSFKSRNIWEGISVLFATTMVVIGYIVEANQNMFNLGNNATAVACLFFFLFLILKFASFDPLTDLHNRQAFYADIKAEKRITALISIDLNGLKEINDKYGHIRGDEALEVVSEKISANLKMGAVAYRTGGDEFIIVCQGFSPEKVRTMCEGIIDSINNKTEFSISLGFAIRLADDSIREMMVRADQMMYHNKAVIKESIKAHPKNEHSGMIAPKPRKSVKEK